MTIKHLVFEGTGVRNAIYAGGLLALEEAGLLGSVESVAGVSSGSIVATLFALGYTPREIADAILDLDFSKLLDGAVITGPLRLLTRYGWHTGDWFRQQMGEFVARKTGHANTTFAEAAARGSKQLFIVGTNLTKRSVRIFPDAISQHMAIADAVRISMSIPLFFASVPYQGDLYVDGGVMWNYPLGLFDVLDQPNDATLGFHVENSPLPASARIWTPHDYFAGLFESLLRQQESDLKHRPLDCARTVTVSDGGVGLADFGIQREGKQRLLDAGVRATRAFLAARHEAHAGKNGAPSRRPSNLQTGT
ncbi:MAG: patatin-like phospholipase family protein [Polyangiales bacterium]